MASEIPQTAEGFLYGVANDLIAVDKIDLMCLVVQNDNRATYDFSWVGRVSRADDAPPVTLHARYDAALAKLPEPRIVVKYLEVDIDESCVNILTVAPGESRLALTDPDMWWFVSTVAECVIAERRYQAGQPAYPLTLCYNALVNQRSATLLSGDSVQSMA